MLLEAHARAASVNLGLPVAQCAPAEDLLCLNIPVILDSAVAAAIQQLCNFSPLVAHSCLSLQSRRSSDSVSLAFPDSVSGRKPNQQIAMGDGQPLSGVLFTQVAYQRHCIWTFTSSF
jgi:hypothetical protein